MREGARQGEQGRRGYGPAGRAPEDTLAQEPEPMEKELQDIRKEIVEARNLVIKNDNLLKNLGSDLKSLGKKQDSFERKQWISSAVAYLLFAVLCAGAAVVASKGYVAQARSEAETSEKKAQEAVAAEAAAKAELAAVKSASVAAYAAYQKLDAGSDADREAAVAALLEVDRSKLTQLESRALDDRSSSVIQKIAEQKLEAGKSAFRRGDFRGSVTELSKALQLWPEHPDANDVSFFLGNAATETKQWEAAVPALQRFLEKSRVRTNRDYAYYLLAVAQENAGDKIGAEATLRKGIAEYPETDYTQPMKRRLSGLRRAAAEAAAASAPAAQ